MGNYFISEPHRPRSYAKSIEAMKKGMRLCEILPQYWDENMLREAIKIDGTNISHISDSMLQKYPDLVIAAVKQNPRALKYIRAKYKTYELCFEAIQKLGILLREVPLRFKDEKMCLVAVENDGLSLQYVPENLKTDELCKLSLKKGQDTLAFFPLHIKAKMIKPYLEA